MKSYLSLLISAFLFFGTITQSFAQRHEYGGALGMMTYKGELADYFNPVFARGAINGLYRYNKNRHIVYRANIVIGSLTGDSRRSNNALISQTINGSFDTPISEGALMLEYNWFDFRKAKHNSYRGTPYLVVGVGGFYFEPKQQENGSLSAVQPTLPIGFGYKYAASRHWNVNFEFVSRPTFTGLLDGHNNRAQGSTAQRGFRNILDWYNVASVGITYVLYTIECPQEFKD